MKPIVSACAVILFSACMCFGQVPTPPGNGVGLGNTHLSSNSSVDNPISMSANVNAMITDTSGSVTGDTRNPAFAGVPGSDTATRANSRGTTATSSSTSATWARRSAYGENENSQTEQRHGKQENSSGKKK
jgi:hypothetical protein